MANSLHLAAGLTTVPRAPVRRAPWSPNRACGVPQLDRWRSVVAANRRLQLACASRSEVVQEGSDDVVETAGVESLLTEGEPNQEGEPDQEGEPNQEGESEVAEAAAEEPVVDAIEGASESKAEEGPPAVQPVPGYVLNFLWLDRNVAVAVDQVFSKDQKSPMTEYFFWPRNDAWEDLKTCLEGKPWVQERDKVLLLNRTTEVINYWQDEESRHSLADASAKFPDCTFSGA